MSDTQTIPDSALDGLLGNDIPCGKCGKPAQLRSFVHHCQTPTIPVPAHKCIACWQAWATDIIKAMSNGARLGCRDCYRHFETLEDFSDYREF